jgi:hypothetical protein
MTEEEWMACADPGKMLKFLQDSGKLSERKGRLFGVACCRRIWPLLIDERSRTAVEVAEQHADGLVAKQELHAAYLATVPENRNKEQEWFAWSATHAVISNPASVSAKEPWYQACLAIEEADSRRKETNVQAALLRDIFGPLPFRPAGLPSSIRLWNDGCAVKLATALYEDRSLPSATFNPARLSILADALEEAGCTDEALLTHLRSPGPHVRGCWALDRLLAKE